jgi:hypothetical protein
VPRTIHFYEKEGDAFIHSIEFSHDDLEFFLEIFDNPKEDPLLYDVYHINAEHNRKIFERFGVMVDIDRYDCFVEYYE